MREKSLRLSLIDAFLYSLMIGAGETYLPAYSLSIGMGEIFAGVLSTLPIVSGAFLQLITPRGLQRVQSHKNWVVASAILQALTFVPLIYFSATRAPNFWTLFFILTLYWGSGFSAGPAWNYWMGRLVQVEEGNRYFAKRARVSQIGILLGLIGGGVALHNNVEIGPFSSVFTLLFVFAFGCRLVSSFVLSSQFFDPTWKKEPKLGFRASWKVFWANTSKRQFFFYLAPFQAAVFVSSPFVTPYMLAQVKMDYGTYMTAIGVLFVGKILALSLIDRYRGNISGFNLLVFGAGAIVPLPAMWAISSHSYYIFALQLLSGLSWAFVEVGLSLIFFKDIKQEEKVPVLTVYNLLNSLAIIFGTYVGGKFLWYFGENVVSYYAVFILGTVARAAGFVPLYRYIKNQSLDLVTAKTSTSTEKAS
ncbi:MFS transporter [Bdellovibrio sp. 22V]|uniref:MFS transporter n=1 Tax=Bdellovibrio sp. 22V TaxID=3044166 RepID=UPI002542A6FC|nr:MFS transporter [Bdellovibrio sp. 22V]WII71792.1 MFS transporter [Bdellovibrio sp. 22V]